MKSHVELVLLSATLLSGVYAWSSTTHAQEYGARPAAPAAPAAPSAPAAPALPSLPAMPAAPAAPAAPASPALPALPAAPAAPAMPAENELSQWNGHHSTSIGGGHQPAESCADLRIRFDERDAVVKSEERTVTKAEAATLRVHPHTNGGVQVQGWDRDTYSVTACKAAADDGDAERLLSQITFSVQNGEVSTDGPRSENSNWTVYLLIRAPKSSSLDIETLNGPLSLYSVDGKLTAHATNGPIALHDFSGEADVHAQNGPISIKGSSGNLRVHTENGPISVDLKGKSWSGEGLSADAKNGPLTLFVPSDYQSGFVVESRNYSPMNCRASVCDNARKTWDDTNRRIEYGNGPALIHLSTVNGPVSVRSAGSGEDM